MLGAVGAYLHVCSPILGPCRPCETRRVLLASWHRADAALDVEGQAPAFLAGPLQLSPGFLRRQVSGRAAFQKTLRCLGRCLYSWKVPAAPDASVPEGAPGSRHCRWSYTDT